MFLVRSAFWLFLAFLVFRPGIDLGASANAVEQRTISAAAQLTMAHLRGDKCVPTACAVTMVKAVLPAEPPPPLTALPLPRPRPVR